MASVWDAIPAPGFEYGAHPSLLYNILPVPFPTSNTTFTMTTIYTVLAQHANILTSWLVSLCAASLLHSLRCLQPPSIIFHSLFFGTQCSQPQLIPVPLKVGPSTSVAVGDLHKDIWLYKHYKGDKCAKFPCLEEVVKGTPGKDSFHFFFQPQDDICGLHNHCVKILSLSNTPVIGEILVLKSGSGGGACNILERDKGLVEYLMYK